MVVEREEEEPLAVVGRYFLDWLALSLSRNAQVHLSWACAGIAVQVHEAAPAANVTCPKLPHPMHLHAPCHSISQLIPKDLPPAPTQAIYHTIPASSSTSKP